VTLDLENVVAISGAIVAIAGAYSGIKKVFRDVRKSREEQKAIILQEAKEEISRNKIIYDNKIRSLRDDLENFKESINKDITHVKEVHGGEMRVLSDKIENLREELREQHLQMLNLLTKLVDRA